MEEVGTEEKEAVAAEKAAAARRAAWCGMQLWLARRRRAGTGAVSNPAATFGRGAMSPIARFAKNNADLALSLP